MWKYAKPQVLLTAPNRNHFVQVLDFLDAIAKAKNLICESFWVSH